MDPIRFIWDVVQSVLGRRRELEQQQQDQPQQQQDQHLDLASRQEFRKRTSDLRQAERDRRPTVERARGHCPGGSSQDQQGPPQEGASLKLAMVIPKRERGEQQQQQQQQQQKVPAIPEEESELNRCTNQTQRQQERRHSGVPPSSIEIQQQRGDNNNNNNNNNICGTSDRASVQSLPSPHHQPQNRRVESSHNSGGGSQHEPSVGTFIQLMRDLDREGHNFEQRMNHFVTTNDVAGSEALFREILTVAEVRSNQISMQNNNEAAEQRASQIEIIRAPTPEQFDLPDDSHAYMFNYGGLWFVGSNKHWTKVLRLAMCKLFQTPTPRNFPCPKCRAPNATAVDVIMHVSEYGCGEMEPVQSRVTRHMKWAFFIPTEFVKMLANTPTLPGGRQDLIRLDKLPFPTGPNASHNSTFLEMEFQYEKTTARTYPNLLQFCSRKANWIARSHMEHNGRIARPGPHHQGSNMAFIYGMPWLKDPSEWPEELRNHLQIPSEGTTGPESA